MTSRPQTARLKSFAGFLIVGLGVFLLTCAVNMAMRVVAYGPVGTSSPSRAALVTAAVVDLCGVAVSVYSVAYGTLRLAIPRIIRRSQIEFALAIAGVVTATSAYFDYVEEQGGMSLIYLTYFLWIVSRPFSSF